MKKELIHREIATLGGKARWANTTPEQRSKIMRKVSKARLKKPKVILQGFFNQAGHLNKWRDKNMPDLNLDAKVERAVGKGE